MAAVRKTKIKAPTEADQQRAALEAQLKAARRMIRVHKAREQLMDFTYLTMPHPEDPDDADRSRYEASRHHEALSAVLEEVEKGNKRRLIITMPPRHGKSEKASRRFPAWYVGRDPYRQLILATYNDTFAEDFGRKVREIMRMPVYRQIFPDVELRKGSQAADRLELTEGGVLHFVGRGGSTTGRGADCFLIDDPIKDRIEANSPTIRDTTWDWFNDVVKTRLINEFACIILIMTRWHEDDIVGRLTDPKNPHYPYHGQENPWEILDLPALAEDGDPLGRPKDTALWPERFSTTYLKQLRKENPRTFSALYQGRPSPDNGTYFRREWFVPYAPQDLPKALRFYAASDHAPGAKQDGDKNCLGCVGVDENDVIWVLPDLFWKRADAMVTTEAIIDQMERHHPIFWWGENEHIMKAFGPFLRKRMRERKIYSAIDPLTSSKDLQIRATAIQGRMAMKMVRFPTFAPWWSDAQDELTKFPNGTHDDFVSFLSLIGRGLDRMTGAKTKLVYAPPKEPPTGSFAWMKWAANYKKQQQKRIEASEGW